MKNKLHIISVVIVSLLLTLTFSCKKEVPKVIPTLTTAAASSITSTTATSGGTITNDGGAPVTSRGVCWSLNQSPTTSDNKTSDGSGIGSFTSSITGLTPGGIYYVRAYATNSVGTAYRDQISFTTTATSPILSTTNVSSIAQTTANSGGNITNDGGKTIIARGVCWSTNQNPTITDGTTNNGTGSGSFSSSIIGLTPLTTYYVRAYATNQDATGYGNQISFNTTVKVTGVTLNVGTVDLMANETYELIATVIPANADNKKVIWSSNNSNIATITNDGILTTKTIGSVVIKAITEDGNFTASCSVSVVPITGKISLAFTSGGYLGNLSYSVGGDGLTNGSLYSMIVNGSKYDINLIQFIVIDSRTNAIIFGDSNRLGLLRSGESRAIAITLSNVYRPIFRWGFTYNGENYFVEHHW